SLGTWFDHRIVLREWLRLELGLRGDVFFFDGRNRLRPERADPNFDPVPIAGSTTASIVSPKANLTVTPVRSTDLYLNFGEGYHSNDARNALTGARARFEPLPHRSMALRRLRPRLRRCALHRVGAGREHRRGERRAARPDAADERRPHHGAHERALGRAPGAVSRRPAGDRGSQPHRPRLH